MKILQVSTADYGGGAEGSALGLFQAFARMGHQSWLAVGRKYGETPGIFKIPNDSERCAWERFWNAVDLRASIGGPSRWIANPRRQAARALGREDFGYPASDRLPALTPQPPDIIHCHNLHGGYFDLRALPRLSRRFPVLLDLRDEWLLTGHCSYSLGCDRWMTGCGKCPHLDTYPAVRRDATRFNWNRKRRLVARCTRVAISAPSRWLLSRAQQAMFPAVPARVIPNGIDVALFQPGDGPTPARERLALPPEAFIVAYTGHSPFKDSQTAEHAFATLPKHPQQELIFIQLGVEGPAARIGAGRRLRAGMVRDPSRLVDYYRAADVFVHAAHAEAFGKTATEAMACGTPVVATAVGGLIEQIEDGRSGLLTPPGDAAALAAALAKLWSDPAMRSQIGRHGADNARIRFSLERQAHAVLDWHKEVIAAWRHGQ